MHLFVRKLGLGSSSHIPKPNIDISSYTKGDHDNLILDTAYCGDNSFFPVFLEDCNWLNTKNSIGSLEASVIKYLQKGAIRITHQLRHFCLHESQRLTAKLLN